MGELEWLRRLVEDLRETARPVRVIAETLARLLGCERGQWQITLDFTDGKLRRLTRRHGPIGADAAEDLAAS